MKNVKIFIFFFLASLLPSLPSPAQGIPVYDAASYAQLLTQLDQMTKEYQKQIEELSEAIKQTNALTGTRNMGDLANGSLENDLRRYLPNTWKETMDMINATGLNPAGQETQQSFNRLYTAYAPIKGEDLIASAPESSTAKIFNRSTTTTLAAMSAGEELFNSIPKRINTYETLLTEINNTEDLKASIDLLARISAENGLALNEMMRLNAIQIQQKAAQDSQTLDSYKRAHTANQYNPDTANNAFKLEE